MMKSYCYCTPFLLLIKKQVKADLKNLAPIANKVVHKKLNLVKKLFIVLNILAFCFIGTVTGAWFEEVTPTTGIAYTGQSFGASWGDVNGDGWPDLWVGNHGWFGGTRLYINNTDGTFTEHTFIVPPPRTDSHGSAWADFDNDGDQDLLRLTGARTGTGSVPNQFFINSVGQLTEKAQQFGLDYPLARGRTPLWFDWDNDGDLDVFLANWPRTDGQAPSALFSQNIGGFFDSFPDTGVNTSSNNKFAQLIALGSEHSPALVIDGNPFPDRAYDYSRTPFVDLNGAMGLFPTDLRNSQDAAVADFDGDLQTDIFLTQAKSGSAVTLLDPNTVAASISFFASERGFSVSGGGTLQVRVEPPYRIKAENVFIGSQAVNPSSLTFVLTSTDSGVIGMPAHTPGVDFGLFVGYEPALNQWQFLASKDKWLGVSFLITTSEPVASVAPIEFMNYDGGLPDVLLVQNGAGFSDISATAGVTTASPCESVTAADFDNDMDVDLYLVCRGATSNRPNILYENMGDGTFQSIVDAGDAQGSIYGRGESVASADYDRDGFVDLFVTNGRGDAPFNDGPSQILHNLGNGNHWIEIDLEGVVSNRDSIGAVVLATANGITQMRLQGGGMHRSSQDHKRIHFGLADNTVVDTVTVKWPSGITQTINSLPADEIVHVLEPSFPSLAGKPIYQLGQDVGFYLWKDTFDGPYHIETSGGGPQSVFSVELIADHPITSVTPQLLEVNDSLVWSGSHMTFESRVTSSIDGVNFELPPGTNAIVAVTQDGSPNPRQLHIGATGQPLTSSGWIVEADTLPASPSFQGGYDLGLFIGRDPASGEVRARWNGDGSNHHSEIKLLFSQSPSVVTPVRLEFNDVLAVAANAVSIDSYVSVSWDGVNVGVSPGTHLGLAYTQDGLIQPHRVNPVTRNLGLPNAYWLPRAEPYGAPAYDPGVEAGLYLWQDKATDTWHLRAAAGGGSGHYTGDIVSDQPFTRVSAVRLEANDLLETTDPTRIAFNLRMWSQWEDGIDFQTAPGAQVTLNLTAGHPFATPSEAISIGNLKWPVEQVPLELGGW